MSHNFCILCIHIRMQSGVLQHRGAGCGEVKGSRSGRGVTGTRAGVIVGIYFKTIFCSLYFIIIKGKIQTIQHACRFRKNKLNTKIQKKTG